VKCNSFPKLARLISLAALVSMLTACVHTNSSTREFSNSGQIYCTKQSGYVQGPYVASEETAGAIAQAIIEDVTASNTEAANYDLIIEDGGDHWDAYQVPARNAVKELDGDTIIVTSGGGGVSMDIAKCDGQITRLHYQR